MQSALTPTQIDSAERLLAPGEVAALLSVSTKTLAQWRWRRIGPAFIKLPGPNGAVRHPAASLVAWRDGRVTPETGVRTDG